ILSVRAGDSAIWTGSEMIVWRGNDFNTLETGLVTGGVYDPATDHWRVTSTTNAPTGRTRQTVVWSGTEMIIWGGSTYTTLFNTGGRYNPLLDTWTPTRADTSVPSPRYGHSAVWTGKEMIVWGGWQPAP